MVRRRYYIIPSLIRPLVIAVSKWLPGDYVRSSFNVGVEKYVLLSKAKQSARKGGGLLEVESRIAMLVCRKVSRGRPIHVVTTISLLLKRLDARYRVPNGKRTTLASCVGTGIRTPLF